MYLDITFKSSDCPIYIYVCVIIFSYIFGYTLIKGNDDDDPPLDFGVPHF